MRVGIIGLGYRLGYLARVFSAARPDFSVAGYVDPAPAGLPYATEHGISVGKQYGTLEAMLDSEQLDLLMVEVVRDAGFDRQRGAGPVASHLD